MTDTVRAKPTTTHAPAPWHIEPLQADNGGSIAICNRQQGVLAVIPPLNEDELPDEATAQRDPHDEANARLIAVAPEMLAKHEWIADAAADTVKNYSNDIHVLRGMLRDIAGSSHTVIAKATGRAA